MDSKEQFSSLPVVTESAPTADGEGRLYRMEPGKRVVLGELDQWQHNESEPVLEQSRRVFFTNEEQKRRKDGARRLKESFSRNPFYVDAAKRHGDEDAYWDGFYASRIQW